MNLKFNRSEFCSDVVSDEDISRIRFGFVKLNFE